MLKRLLYILTCSTAWMSATAQNIEGGEYFFDADPGMGNGIAFSLSPAQDIEEVITIQTTGLSNGMHHLGIRLRLSDGTWSHYRQSQVYISSPANIQTLNFPPLISGEYFFDADPGLGNGTAFSFAPDTDIEETILLSTTGLSNGMHHLGIRLKREDATWGHYRQSQVYISSPANIQTDNFPDLISGEYFFDADPGVGNGTAFSFPPDVNIEEQITLSTTGLSNGMHHLGIRLKREDATWGHFRQSQVYISAPINTQTDNFPPLIAGEYFFNADPGVGNGTAFSFAPNTDIEEMVEVMTTGLPLGTHHLGMRLKREDALWGHYHQQQIEIIDCTGLEDNVNLSETACGYYLIGGDSLTVSNAYVYTFINQFGCDSIVNLDLTIIGEIDQCGICYDLGQAVPLFGTTCGCTDPLACNYDPVAVDDDGSCIADITAPAFTFVPADIFIECDQTIPFNMAIAEDDCNDVFVSFTENINTGFCNNDYSIQRMFTATDEAGNSATVVQMIYVSDTTAPVLDGDPEISIDPAGMGNIFISALDNCGSTTITLSITPVSGDAEFIYEYAAFDDCGNVSLFTQVVFVVGGMTANCQSTLASCFDSADGTATVTVNGGVPPYNYQWSNGGLTSTITDLLPGLYSVIVTDDGSLSAECTVEVQSIADTVTGCMDPDACNYNPLAFCPEICDFDTCAGCTDPSACEYDPAATIDNGTCTYPGCTDPTACNFEPAAGCDDGSCIPAPAQLTVTVLAGGNPVANIAVQLFYYDAAAATQSSISLLTDAAGQVIFEDAPVGEHICRASPDYQIVAQQGFLPTYTNEAYLWWNAEIFDMNCGDILEKTIDIIELSNTTGPGQVSGHVYYLTDAWGMGLEGGSGTSGSRFLDGDPIPGIPVIILKDTTQAVSGQGLIPIAIDLSSGLGEYDFQNLPLGNYRLHVDMPGLNHLIAPSGTDSTYFPAITASNLIFEELNFYVDEEDGIYIIDNDTLSVGEYGNLASKLLIFPNPFSDQLQLLTAEVFPDSGFQWEVTDGIGRKCRPKVVLKSSDKMVLDFSGMARGIYFIRLWDGEKSYARKVVKQ